MRAALIALDRLLDRLYVLGGILAALFLVALAVCVLLSILARLTGFYVAGLTAYSGYAMAASSFLALAYTLREGGHIRVALLRNRLHGRARLAGELWCLLVASVVGGYLAWYLARLAYVSWTFGEKSEGSEATPIWIPQSLLAIGATIMAIALVHALVKTALTRDPQAFLRGAAPQAGE